jgi:hypothetical protein
VESEKKWKWQKKWSGKPTLDHIDVSSLAPDVKQKLLEFQDAYSNYLRNYSSTYRRDIDGEMLRTRLALEHLPEFKPFLLNPNEAIDCLSGNEGPDGEEERKALDAEYKRREYEVFKLSLRIEDRRTKDIREGLHLN